MANNALIVNLTLLLVAVVWGFGFVPQRLGMEYLEPAAFNALRFGIGAITLLPLLLWFGKKKPEGLPSESTTSSETISASPFISITFSASTLKLGLVLGGLLFGGATFQQIAIQYTTLANVAFITGLSVIIVPIIGLFIGYRYGLVVWSGGFIAAVGLYFMTGGSTQLELKGDILALIGSVFWAIHLLVLAKKAGQHEQLTLAFYQFVFCAGFSVIAALVQGEVVFPTQAEAYLWPFVNGFLVVAVGYTLQVLVMDKADPFAAALIFSLEAVFGAIAGYFVFQEQLGVAALWGAAMMMAGCILAQMPNGQLEEDGQLD